MSRVVRPIILKWRFFLVAIALCLLPLALAWQLAHLQVLSSVERGFQFLQDAGKARTLRREKINAYRGVISDRNGELLAVSTPLVSLYANPQKINQDQLPELADSLGLSLNKLKKRLVKYKNKQFMYLLRHQPPHQAEQVLAKDFSGVYKETEYRRFYPAAEVAAHVVGMTNVDDRGQEGIERSFDSWLKGESGAKHIVKDLRGRVVKELDLIKAPIPGKDLQLTIDLRLQYFAHKELKTAIHHHAAKSGSVVILDVASSEILAMVNHPSYNPNDRGQLKPKYMRNRALTDVFEPGSTVKPFAVIAALETGKFSPNFEIDTSPGHVRFGGKTFVDPVNYGVMNLTKIIQKSSQVGITKLAMQIEPDAIRDVYFRMGFGQATGIGFPGENSGILPSRSRWHPVEIANFAFGYGLSMNAVQLAQAYRTLAARGQFKYASIVKNVSTLPEKEVMTAELAEQVKEMLFTVTQKGGTGTRAHIDAYPVAGKSGTAHVSTASGYADDRYISFFAGMAPYKNPQIVAVVIIHEASRGEYFGGEVAAPVFAKVVSETLQTLHVPPANSSRHLVRHSGVL